VLGSLVVHLLKDCFARVRPLTVFGDSVHVLGERLYRCSFPSGHTQASFGAAAFLSCRLPKQGWLFFLIAAGVGISRIYVGAHFPLDVAAGAAIGAGVALAGCAVERRFFRSSSSNREVS
jgi:undecaprenyl-diphosphatase